MRRRSRRRCRARADAGVHACFGGLAQLDGTLACACNEQAEDRSGKDLDSSTVSKLSSQVLNEVARSGSSLASPGTAIFEFREAFV